MRGLLWRRPYKRAEITPHVSMIIAAYNEASIIEAKLDNSLAFDYPHDRLEVVIASDGSNDDTESIVRSYAAQGVRLLALPRRGKIPALNDAVVASTSNEVLVFSDANSMFAPDAIRALVRPFADPIAGNVSYDSGTRTATFTPDSLLKADTTHTVKLSRDIQDTSGNELFGTGTIREQWSFTTGSTTVQFSSYLPIILLDYID